MATIKAGSVHTYSTRSFLASAYWKPRNIVLTSTGELLWFKDNRIKKSLDLRTCGMDALEVMPWAAMQTATGPPWRLALTTPATGRVFLAFNFESDMDAWIVAFSRILGSNDRCKDRVQRVGNNEAPPSNIVC
ncbi:Aste57867_12867 [Aphanomyces stellatus]|uniref:Aste57867_12867 protein n=1 Tax=Aphanomyces stellatus TaxID=120398 RepID=A0A485KX42_9STRA|nr:hypothetical protein As57867_012819 [Aphanomyces stellatus]VFT89714.1 Aste57867_12867 [Aphanomyces stellatus]